MSTIQKRPNHLINIGCLDPVKAPHGSKIEYYPCGKCLACQMKKANNNSQQTWFEFNGSKVYPLFVLLTYNNENLPMCLCEYCPSTNTTRSGLPLYYVRITDILDGVVLYDSEMPVPQLKKLHKHATKENNGLYVEPFDKEGGSFQFSRVRQYDLQLFHKRLRRQIEKAGLHSYRFGACSEYGPTTNRPHYHLILFCRNELERYKTYKLVPSCWKLGFVSAKYYSGTGCNYISSYITSSESISPLHQRVVELRPKFTHSIHFGFNGCARYNGDLQKMLDEPKQFFQSVLTPCDGKLKELFPLCQYYRSTLPKLPRHDAIFTGSRCKVVHGTYKPQISNLLQAYFAPYFFIKRYGTNVSSLPSTDQVFDYFNLYIDNWFRYVSVKEIDEDLIPVLENQGWLFKMESFEKKFIRDYIITVADDLLGHVDTKLLYDRIKRAIRVCKQHYRNFIDYAKLKRFDTSYYNSVYQYMYHYISRVHEFYSCLDAEMLKNQLDKLARAAIQYGWIQTGVHLYDSLDKSLEVIPGEYWLEPELEKHSSLYYENVDYLKRQAEARSKTKKIKEHYTLKNRKTGFKAFGSNRLIKN